MIMGIRRIVSSGQVSISARGRSTLLSSHRELNRGGRFIRAPRRRGRGSWAGLSGRAPSQFQIKYQFEFGRLLDRQVGGLGALQDLVNISRDAPRKVEAAGAVGYQSAIDDKLAQPVYRWESTLRGEFDNAFPMRDEEHISINHQGIGVLLGDRAERYREICR